MAKDLESNMTAKEVIDFRLRHRLSKDDLAEILGLSVSAITMWETKQRGVSVPLRRLFDLFDRKPELMNEF